ncbi:hypothetical protein [Methanoculleus frigidifontis]|nr:hypothetical protein [Methanoculleus sp. FWC-SCC1]
MPGFSLTINRRILRLDTDTFESAIAAFNLSPSISMYGSHSSG